MFIATTRFNDQTFLENERWRTNHNWEGCIYGSPKKISDKVPPDCRILVIEMNNSKPEKIMGFGLILNHPRYDFKANIYSDTYYNRVIYRSDYRKDRSQIENTEILKFLEEILFRGKTHQKRARGITILPLQIKDGYFTLPEKITMPQIIKDLENKKTIQQIIKKYWTLRIQLTLFYKTLF
tara:strand:+ start:2866 stop:3408 length:543 start_codon:yes stop_codon:yes gene_type:complete